MASKVSPTQRTVAPWTASVYRYQPYCGIFFGHRRTDLGRVRQLTGIRNDSTSERPPRLATHIAVSNGQTTITINRGLLPAEGAYEKGPAFGTGPLVNHCSASDAWPADDATADIDAVSRTKLAPIDALIKHNCVLLVLKFAEMSATASPSAFSDGGCDVRSQAC